MTKIFILNLTIWSTISAGMGRTSDADQRLMDAALSLIREQSYGAITIDVICQRADVKKGSFYYFFASKSELAAAALERFWQEQKPLWDSHFSPTIPPLQRIQAHCDAVYQQQRAGKAQHGRVLGCPLCTLGAEICKQDEVLRAKVCGILESELKYWESAINDAQRDGAVGPGNTADKAKCAAAYFEGLLAQARLHNDAEMLAVLGEKVREHIVACSQKTYAPAPAKRALQEEFDSTKD